MFAAASAAAIRFYMLATWFESYTHKRTHTHANKEKRGKQQHEQMTINMQRRSQSRIIHRINHPSRAQPLSSGS